MSQPMNRATILNMVYTMQADAVANAYAALAAENERLKSVSEAWKKRRLDKVEAECIQWSDYEKLKEQNSRLCKEKDDLAAENERLAASVSRLEKENALIREANIAGATVSKTVSQENEVLRRKVDWLMKADRLVIWNGTEWQVRHVVEGEKRDAQ